MTNDELAELIAQMRTADLLTVGTQGDEVQIRLDCQPFGTERSIGSEFRASPDMTESDVVYQISVHAAYLLLHEYEESLAIRGEPWNDPHGPEGPALLVAADAGSAPTYTINVPEPQVEVHVEAPVVNVPAPIIQMPEQRRRRIRRTIERDEDGIATGMIEEELDDYEAS
jgi:hypothetical protein